MIFKDSIEAFIESVYLQEPLISEIGKSNILVNPRPDRLELDYTMGKTVVLNDQYTEPGVIKKLLENGNRVISRTEYYAEISGVEIRPYIIRVDFDVMWNGDTQENLSGTGRDIIKEIGALPDDGGPYRLFFPKIKGLEESLLHDRVGNLTALGWIQHQVGENSIFQKEFMDLDLLKLKKISR